MITTAKNLARIAVGKMNLPPDHVPAWVDKARLAALIHGTPSLVDEFVECGLLPKPRRLAGTERWNTEKVREYLSGTIYVVGFLNYVKIGFSQDRKAKMRIAGLQSSCPEELIVYSTFNGSLVYEQTLHKRFSKLRLRGEWFRFEGELKEWIEQGCPL